MNFDDPYTRAALERDPVFLRVLVLTYRVVFRGADPPALSRSQQDALWNIALQHTPTLIAPLAAEMREEWDASADSTRDRRAMRDQTVEADIQAAWGDGLVRFARYVACAASLHEMMGRRRKAQLGAGASGAAVDAILALYSRGILVAEEVHALARGGYASGALARWRTLHELAVIATVIAEHEDRERLAARFVEHEAVGALEAMQAYDKHCAPWGLEPHPPEQVAELERQVDELSALHSPGRKKGKETFDDAYGWAEGFVPRGPRRNSPSFADLEKQTKLLAGRPAYVAASHAIHGGFRGLTGNPGQRDPSEPTLLTGASAAGLHQPLALSTWSLSALTHVLAQVEQFPAEVCHAHAMKLLGDETIDSLALDLARYDKLVQTSSS